MQVNITGSVEVTGPDGFHFKNTQEFADVGQELTTKVFGYMGSVLGKIGQNTTGDFNVTLAVGLKDAATGADAPLPSGVQPTTSFACTYDDVARIERMMLDETKALLGTAHGLKAGKWRQKAGHGGAAQHGKP